MLIGYAEDSGARLAANKFLDLGTRDGVAIDPMKIQKLVYLNHGWSLAFYGTPVALRPIEAWRYGPVIPDLYQAFRKFRANPITEGLSITGNYMLTDQARKLIENVWNTYKSYSAVQLSMLTHESGGAWDTTIKSEGGFWGSSKIPNELIAEEFKRRQKQG